MARHREEAGAQITLSKPQFKALLAKHPEFKQFDDQWRYLRDESSVLDVSVRYFSLAALEQLYAMYKDGGSKMGDRWAMGQIAAHIAALKNPDKAKVEQLRALQTMMIAYIKKNIINGWLFKKEEARLQPVLVYDVYYVKRVVEKDYSQPAHVVMVCSHWEKGKKDSMRCTWYSGDVLGKTCEEILLKEGLYKETAEMVADYEKEEAQFLEWRKMLGEQFVGHGEFQAKGSSRRDNPDSKMAGTRLICDDRCDDIRQRETTNLFSGMSAAEVEEFEPEDQPQSSERDEEAMEKFTRLPLTPFIWCFNLSSYNSGWVHMADMTQYVYRPELREKLILKPEHSELIDILTADMNVLMEDVITGKSGGTAILCQGEAGTGKTLTAEVYAEVIKRPLYRVHSGQLGTNAGTVESALKEALENAMRWRAVLLIDEADVFISHRGEDLEKNAVIGVFLRVLEYYSGLLFMTTNRVDTIDDAILSRCIAKIKYERPDEPERLKLWKTLGGVYGLDLVKDEKFAAQLAKRFNCNGRDIKGLIKLVTKLARVKKKKITLDDFVRMGTFKGL